MGTIARYVTVALAAFALVLGSPPEARAAGDFCIGGYAFKNLRLPSKGKCKPAIGTYGSYFEPGIIDGSVCTSPDGQFAFFRLTLMSSDRTAPTGSGIYSSAYQMTIEVSLPSLAAKIQYLNIGFIGGFVYTTTASYCASQPMFPGP